MQFDLTNITDQGFVVLPPDRYAVVTTDDWWVRQKEGSDNKIIDVDVKVVAGNYKDEITRYFHTITNNEQTLGFLLRFLRSVGVIKEGDRGADGKLVVKFNFGEKDGRGRVKIKSVMINDQERAVAGYKAIAVITEYTDNNTGDKRTSIDRFEQVDQPVADAGPAPAATPQQGSGWPF